MFDGLKQEINSFLAGITNVMQGGVLLCQKKLIMLPFVQNCKTVNLVWQNCA